MLPDLEDMELVDTIMNDGGDLTNRVCTFAHFFDFARGLKAVDAPYEKKVSYQISEFLNMPNASGSFQKMSFFQYMSRFFIDKIN